MPRKQSLPTALPIDRFFFGLPCAMVKSVRAQFWAREGGGGEEVYQMYLVCGISFALHMSSVYAKLALYSLEVNSCIIVL